MTTQAWNRLEEYHFDFEDTHLKELFAADPERFKKFSLQFEDVLVDFSKNLVDEEIMQSLFELANE